MTEIKDNKLQADKMTRIIFMEMMQVQYDKIVEQNKRLQTELRGTDKAYEELSKNFNRLNYAIFKITEILEELKGAENDG